MFIIQTSNNTYNRLYVIVNIKKILKSLYSQGFYILQKVLLNHWFSIQITVRIMSFVFHNLK
jgi:hypothetical protein